MNSDIWIYSDIEQERLTKESSSLVCILEISGYLKNAFLLIINIKLQFFKWVNPNIWVRVIGDLDKYGE